MSRRRGGSLASHWATANGWRIHARVTTDTPPATGLPVVLIHGLSVSGRYLLPTAARLAADRCVYVPDLPGFGGSEQPPNMNSECTMCIGLLSSEPAVGVTTWRADYARFG
jgi:2-hydroxy-6-oxonona-2,4-dienedioate hydrolase